MFMKWKLSESAHCVDYVHDLNRKSANCNHSKKYSENNGSNGKSKSLGSMPSTPHSLLFVISRFGLLKYDSFASTIIFRQ